MNIDEKWLQNLPFPLSRLMQNVVRLQRTANPFRFLELTFATTKFLTYITLAEYLQTHNDDAPKHNRFILNSLEKPSDGTWVSLLDYLLKISKPQNFFSQEIASVLKIDNRLIDVFRENVELRNDIVHRHDSINHKVIIKKLENNLQSLQPLWDTLCDYNLYGKTGVLFKGLPPFNETSLTNDKICLYKEEKCLSLSPWLFSTEDIFFYSKQQQQRFFYINYNHGGQSISSDLDPDLTNKCREILQNLQQNALPKNQDLEQKIALDFSHICEFHQTNFVGREDIMEKCRNFVDKACGEYGVVTGEAGIGKTAFFAHMYQQNPHYIWHFCANTENRNNAQVFFRSLLAQTYAQFPEYKEEISFSVKKLQFQWQQLLKKISRSLNDNKKFVFVIDALDEALIGSNDESIPHLLPKNLPPNIVGILSIRKDQVLEIPLQDNITYIATLEKLTQRDILQLLTKKIGVNENEISNSVVDIIWNSSSNGDPFYLRFMADAIRSGSISIHNISLMPKSLEGFFEESWFTLPVEEDFLAYRILGLLAIMQTSGSDALFANLLRKSEDTITNIRLKINKFLVMSKDNYTIFHQKFRLYVIDKFTDKDIADFHSILLEYYDIVHDGVRKVETFSEDGLHHVTHHAYHYGLLHKDFSSLYSIVSDNSFLKHKQSKLATRFVLEDLHYAISASKIETDADITKFAPFVKYCVTYNKIINRGRQQVPETALQLIVNKEYDAALREALLIHSEEERFYQLLILGLPILENNLTDEWNYIASELNRLPTPTIDYGNLPLFSVFCQENIRRNISIEFVDYNRDLWQKMLAFSLAENLTCTTQLTLDIIKEENDLIAAFSSIEINDKFVSSWHSLVKEHVEDPFIMASILLPYVNKTQFIDEIFLLIGQIKQTQNKALLLLKLIAQGNCQNTGAIIEIINTIEDEGVKLHLASAMLQKYKHLPQMDVIKMWLQESSSLIKKFPLEVTFALYDINENNLEEKWLETDELIQDLGSSNDAKQVRKLIDVAKALVFVTNREIQQELASKIAAEIYKISDESLRREVLLSISETFVDQKIYSIGIQLIEQLLYTIKAPWNSHNDYLKRILSNIKKVPQKEQEYVYGVLWTAVLPLFPQEMLNNIFSLLCDVLPYSKNNQQNMLKFISERSISAQLFYQICKWLPVNVDIKPWYSWVKAVQIPTLKAKCMFCIAEVAYKQDKNLCLEWMLEGQKNLLCREDALYPKTIYECCQKVPQEYPAVSELSSWEAHLFAGLSCEDFKQFNHHLEKSLQLIVEIPNEEQRFRSMRFWLQQLIPVTELGRYRSMFSFFQEAVAASQNSFWQSQLIFDLNLVLKSLNKPKEIKQFFHNLQELIQKCFGDKPLYLYKHIAQTTYTVYKIIKDDAQVYVDQLWKIIETEDDPQILAMLLRSLRSFGSSKKIKEHIESLLGRLNQEKSSSSRSRILLDILSTLNGIEATTRIQRILGKLLQEIELVEEEIEQRKHLVDIAAMLQRIEDFSHMEDIWIYLPRIEKIASKIQDMSQYLLAKIQIANKLLVSDSVPRSKEQILCEITKSITEISHINNLYQKNTIFSHVVNLMYDVHDYKKSLSFIECIPIYQNKMEKLTEKIAVTPYKWQTQMITMAIADKKTLDYLIAVTIKQNIDNCSEIIDLAGNLLIS
ncbi:NACHT domain-containing protein [Candidatus Uabimicrobium sp. HlEnr_7]|uniref:NACHT domain-containing protein n=1 Tax=Candidatus Uabimicrobium helgolandensis TaxID=3095367 RepID=UPI0035570066